MEQHVFIIGSKGIPARYGGFETFVEKLTKYAGKEIRYHVACLSQKSGNYMYHDARCVEIKVPDIGAAKAIYYDCAALETFISYCKKHREIKKPIFYVLACRIGFFIKRYKKLIENIGGVLYINPDGHEWKRGKWSKPVQWYWKISEHMMIKQADHIICDSRVIEKYIHEEYNCFHPVTSYIAYGAEKETACDKEQLAQWLAEKALLPLQYYILVGRFVPENNFEVIIKEFMSSRSRRKLLIVTGKNDRLKKRICRRTCCEKDSRIVFSEAVYEQSLLCGLRENAYGSFHGHEVGGTNPSLLEGMLCTKLNLVLDVAFNREVGAEAVLYWNKEPGNLSRMISRVDEFTIEERNVFGKSAVQRIQNIYNWKKIEKEYRGLFCNGKTKKEDGICRSF